jgi:hypothetical protein
MSRLTNLNPADIARTLSLFHVDDAVLEIRALEAGDITLDETLVRRPGTIFGFFDSLEKAEKAIVKSFSAATFPAIYAVYNPINRALLGRAGNRFRLAGKKGGSAQDKDVLRRRYLQVDCDPVRPAGISSTESEKAAAYRVALAIRDYLRARGWPDPVICDSGNGYHLLYRVDLEADDGELVKRALEALSGRFDTEAVKVDTSVFSQAQLTKLYGTAVRKGDDIPERPHRMSAILEMPEVLEIVPEDLVTELASSRKADAGGKTPGKPSSFAGFGLESFVRDHLPQASAPEPWEGGQRWILNVCPFNEEHTGSSVVLLRLPSGAIVFKCSHNSCSGKSWVDVRAMFGAPPPLRAVPRLEPEPWVELVPFDSPVDVPAFPVEALPEELAGFAREIAATVQVPVDMPASLSMSVAASAGARKFQVAIGETHEEPLNLYTADVLPPGERKSETFRHAVAPLEEIERELVRDRKPECQKAATRREIEEKRLAELKARAAKTDDEAERRNLTGEAERLASSLPDVPAEPVVIVGDETAEHLGTVIAQQGGRVALMDADASLFEILAGRYSSGANFELYLRAHAGDTVRVGRHTREGETIERPALTIAVCVQPDVIRGLAATPGFRGRGLIGRFLFALPDPMVGRRLYTNRPLDRVKLATYSTTIKNIFRLPAAGGNDYHRLLLTGEALEEWRTFANRLEAEQVDGGRLAGIRDWASKAAGAAARIAGIFHLVKYQTRAPQTIEIDAETVVAAASVVDYFAGHALAVYGLMDADDRIGLAKKILKWVERMAETQASFDPTPGGPPVLEKTPDGTIVFSLRSLHRHHRSVGSPDDLLPGLAILEKRGYVRRLPEPEKRGMGRPKGTRFEVSPFVTWTEVPEVPEVPISVGAS